MTKAIDITPKWQAVLPILTATLKGPSDFKAIEFAEIELLRMAKLADLYVEQEKAKMCNCSDAQEPHEHCKMCDCVLTSHESETLCRSCEKIQGESK